MSSSASSAVRENASGVLYDLLTAAAGAGLLEKQENLPLDSPSGQTRDRLTGLIAA